MSKISLQVLSKSLGGRDLFRDFSLEVSSGSRLAVVGPNGCGKSTLLRLLSGESNPDSGRVILSSGARLGYAAQELSGDELALPLLAFVMSALPSWGEFWQEWEAASQAKDEAALGRLAKRQAELEHGLGYNPEARAKAILTGLGFDPLNLQRELGEFSGGWRERAKMAKVLVAGADILLLDEPTNHLDLEAVEWLEDYLLGFQGALVFVAHDRVFLDRVGNQVLFLGGEKPLLRSGTFSELLVWKAQAERQREERASQLSQAIERQMAFVSRFRYKATKAVQAQSRLRAAAKLKAELEDVQAGMERPGKSLSFSLPRPVRCDKNVLSASELSFKFPGRTALWPALTFNLYRGQKIALAGPNGAGKSTLLKLITGDLKPSSGILKLGNSVRLGYFSQHQTEILTPGASVMSEMQRLSDPGCGHEELCSVLGLFLLGEPYFDRRVSELSGGEKSRLLLASLFMARANFLVLDEPTNHLDLETREALVCALGDYEGTMLCVAHDRYLLSEAAEVVWAVGPEGLSEYSGGFAEYDEALKLQKLEAQAQLAPAKPDNRQQRQDEKRRQAEERNAIYRELKPKQDRFAVLEAELEELLSRQHNVEQLMADPETYAKTEVFRELSIEYSELSQNSEKLLNDLAGLEEEIRDLERRREEI